MKRKNKIGLLAASLAIMLSTGFAVNDTYAFAATECEHDYAKVVVESTCTTQGFTEYTCNLCGDTYRDNYVNAKGHQYKDIVVPPTCTDKGFTTHFCQECGYQYSDNYIDAFGHIYTDVVFEPTCTEIGYTVHTCDTCVDSFIDKYLPAKGHSYLEEVVEATCGEGGFTKYTCSECGDEYIGNIVEATGHSFAEHIVKATCVAYGYTEHICEDCKSRYVTDYVKPIGHDYTVEVVPATEDQLGYTKHVCQNCGYVFLSDFSTSGDNGYIEVPEEPKPEVHVHSYVLSTVVNKTSKTITLKFDCACGDIGSDSVTVLFTDKNGEIISRKPVGGIVDYSSLSGENTATIIDGYGNILKEFKVEATETSGDNDNSTNPGDTENPNKGHQYIFNSTIDEESKFLTLDYKCKDCDESASDLLTVYFIGTDGETKSFTPDGNGKVDFSMLSGEYSVRVIDPDGIILKEYSVNLKDHSKPTDSSDKTDNSSDKEDETPTTEKEKGNSNNALSVVLPIVIVLLIAGGAVVVIFMKKKKNKKEGK